MGGLLYKGMARRIAMAFPCILLIFQLYSIHPCRAEVTTDGSLGAQVALDGPDFTVTSDLGQIRGGNLYHSFRDFSIQLGESATFNGPASVQNIISRVTGGNASYINGTLRSTIEGADFFLLNPSGVMFGPWAQLDINGSFHASTADYLRLDDGAVFQADPGRESVLSVAQPEAFGFLVDNPAPIRVDDAWLSVVSGETFSLIGGDLDIAGGEWGVKINASGGRLQLVGVGKAGEVNLNTPELLSGPAGQTGTINISDAAISDAYDAAKTVIIKGGRIQIRNTSVAAEGTRGVDGADPAMDLEAASQMEISGSSSFLCFSGGPHKGGDLRLKAAEFIMRDASWIDVIAAQQGPGGDIRIDTQTLTLEGEAEIQVSSYADGASGSIRIDAGQAVALKDSASIKSDASDLGDGGDIKITSRTLDLVGGASIRASSSAGGACGAIEVDADDAVLIDRADGQGILPPGVITMTTGSAAAGAITITTPSLSLRNGGYIYSASAGDTDAGAITLDAGRIELTDGGSIYSFTSGAGRGGDLRIDAPDLALERGAGISVGSSGQGDGGNIAINAGLLNILTDSRIQVRSGGNGACGSVQIDVAADLVIDGGESPQSLTGINSFTSGLASAGGIAISTDTLEIRNIGSISSVSTGEGTSGALTVNADVIHLDNGILSSDSSMGNSADIILRSGAFEAFNGAIISSSSTASGNAGKVDLRADTVLLDGSDISNGTVGDGYAGDITIETSRLTVQNEALIESATLGAGSGGTISIRADNLTVSRRTGDRTTGIFAISADSGSAGNIHIEAGTLNLTNGGAIAADAYGQGNAGEIVVSAATILLAGTDPDMPSDISSSFGEDATGQGGRIQLQNVDDLHLDGNARISVSTAGEAHAGDIAIDAEQISLNGGAIMAFSQAAGEGGDISITAGNMQLMNQAAITAKSTGAGNAGNIYLQAASNLVSHESMINTEAATADGGNIHIRAGRMARFTAGGITASVGGGPTTTGGNLDVQAKYVILDQSRLTANAYEGRGGSINVTAEAYLADSSTQVDASSQKGIQGMVNIDAPFSNLSGSLRPLPKEFLSAVNLLKKPCEARVRGGDYGSFIIRGRDALPVEPGSLQMSPPLEF